MSIFEIPFFWITIAPTYYGLMYTISFIVGYTIMMKRKVLPENQLDTLLIYVFLWVVLGGRFGYIIFYDLNYYLHNLNAIIQVRNWWMSFHWGLIGVILSIYLFCKNYKIQFWKIMDEMAAITPIWLFLGRIGNYINKELLWFPYNGPLAVELAWKSYFPSPLLESFLEWFILFFLLKYIQNHKNFYGQTSGFFLIIYWIFRIIVELSVRMPDEKIGYVIWPFSLWAILSVPMIVLWIFLLIKYSSGRKVPQKTTQKTKK